MSVFLVLGGWFWLIYILFPISIKLVRKSWNPGFHLVLVQTDKPCLHCMKSNTEVKLVRKSWNPGFRAGFGPYKHPKFIRTNADILDSPFFRWFR